MANISSKKEECQLICKRPLSLKDSLSISQPYDEFGQDSNFIKKRNKRKVISEWNVDELPALPIFYIKERTSVKIMDAKPQIIADRVTQCANTMSADLNYDDLKGGVIVSMNRIELCVQLFRINDDSASDAIIVEVRRKNGSSITFHRAARAILKAAKGDPIILPRSLESQTRKDRNIVKIKQSKEDDNLTAEATIEKIDSLLQKDRFDANLLGIESLLNLSSCDSSSKSMTLFTAEVILNGRHSDVIKDTVFSLVRNSSNDEKDESKNIVKSSFNRKMRVCAFSVLANSMEVLSRSDLESKSLDDEWVGDNGLLTTLVCKLKDSEFNLQEAYLAAKCLRTAVRGSTGLKSWAMEQDLFGIVQQSQNEGNRSHTLLGCVLDDILQCLAISDCK